MRTLSIAASLLLVFALSSPADMIWSEDFEGGNLAGWIQTPAGHWTNSTVSPISGARSLKHALSDIASNSAIAAAVVALDVTADQTSWRFSLKNGSWDPSSGNRFHVFVMANESGLLGTTVDGYAVGVNLSGSDDFLKLWRVTDGTAAVVVASTTVDWDASDSMGIEVSRATNGNWEVRVDADGGFDALTWAASGADSTYTDGSFFGLAFLYTATYAGALRMDDILVQQGGGSVGLAPEMVLLPPGTNKSVRVGSPLSFDVVAVEPLGDAEDVIELWATNLPPEATFPPVSGTLPLTNTFDWTPSGPGVTNLRFLASDKDGTNELTVTVTVTDLDPGRVWINELHYDDTGTDTNEGVELAGPAGWSLEGYQLVFYNGSGGASYDAANLSGVIDDEDGAHGAVWFDWPGMQNGAPDGVALAKVDGDTTNLLQFISYEGEFVAADGPAAGIRSVDMGVDQEPAPAEDMTLQLVGDGKKYADFVWAGPRAESHGRLNDGETIRPFGLVLSVR